MPYFFKPDLARYTDCHGTLPFHDRYRTVIQEFLGPYRTVTGPLQDCCTGMLQGLLINACMRHPVHVCARKNATLDFWGGEFLILFSEFPHRSVSVKELKNYLNCSLEFRRKVSNAKARFRKIALSSSLYRARMAGMNRDFWKDQGRNGFPSVYLNR